MRKILEMYGEPITHAGQESVTSNMMATFDLNHDFNISLFTPYHLENVELKTFVENNYGEVFNLNLPYENSYNRFKLKKYVDTFFYKHNKYDVVHINTGSLTTMYVFAKSAKKHGIKTVIIHSHNSLFNTKLINRISKLIINVLIKKYVDYIFGCSEKAIDAKFIGINKKNAKVINNGVDIDKYKFNENNRIKIRSEYKINDKFVIGFVGRMRAQKNPLFLPDMLKYLSSDIVFFVIGRGEYMDELKEKATKLGVIDRFIFAGLQTDTSIFYSVFDAYIMPSKFEGFGIASVEAQLNGLPCILSDRVPSLANISSGTSVLSIANPKLWADKILEIKENKNGQFTRNCFKIDYDKFDRRKTYKFVEEVYKNG